MKRQTLKLSLILAVCLVIGSTMCFAAELNFSDVNEHWAKNEINILLKESVVAGYEDGTFKPNKSILDIFKSNKKVVNPPNKLPITILLNLIFLFNVILTVKSIKKS